MSSRGKARPKRSEVSEVDVLVGTFPGECAERALDAPCPFCGGSVSPMTAHAGWVNCDSCNWVEKRRAVLVGGIESVEAKP